MWMICQINCSASRSGLSLGGKNDYHDEPRPLSVQPDSKGGQTFLSHNLILHYALSKRFQRHMTIIPKDIVSFQKSHTELTEQDGGYSPYRWEIFRRNIPTIKVYQDRVEALLVQQRRQGNEMKSRAPRCIMSRSATNSQRIPPILSKQPLPVVTTPPLLSHPSRLFFPSLLLSIVWPYPSPISPEILERRGRSHFRMKVEE